MVIVDRRVRLRLAGGAVAVVVLLAGVLPIAFTGVVVIAVVDGDAGNATAPPDIGTLAAHLCGGLVCLVSPSRRLFVCLLTGDDAGDGQRVG